MPSAHLDPGTLPGHGRVIVAFSGGPDSVCLLHRLGLARLDRAIECVHIDHGLDAESPRRAERAVEIAEGLGFRCRVIRVEVGAGRGPEASARDARYRALEQLVGPGDLLVTAHHADDQAETILLRLVRGAGPEGLAGIAALRRFGQGWLSRPLLERPRAEIEHWLDQHGLDCIRDPANDCPDFDRNHLRHEVLPRLRERWPGVDAAMRRSARLCRGAADFLASRVASDLERADAPGEPLALNRLADDGAYYRGAVIRAWCLRQRVEPPPGRRLDAFLEQLTRAGSDRCPELRWGGQVLRCWDERLWLENERATMPEWAMQWDGDAALELPAELGTLELRGPSGPRLALEVRSGRPGDALQPAGHAHHRDCKRLLAEAGVPPWQRYLWPRLWLDGRLVALGTRWRTAEFDQLLDQRRQSLVWEPGARRIATTAVESRS
ncbi:tRNA lysidine(34) synthetase TilS [Wenzhouxiangella sp. EGI_FJ10409]|uniref:tRNA lysidine(34) synthetase TilS n=1 Tax=Wenzhouxiangella sp. EGI_FJ10409 TaxID=3243767 RepID=UPI0035DFACCC